MHFDKYPHVPTHGHGFGKCGRHGHLHGPMRLFPFILVVPLTIAVASVVGIFLYKRVVVATETLAMTAALDKLEDQLSDGERADLEMRIRENLFG